MENEENALVNINDIPYMKEIVKSMPERFHDIQLTEKEALTLKDALANQKYFGEHAALPLDCTGPSCCMAKTCPLMKINKVPLGSKCAIELTMMRIWKEEYGTSLDVDWNDKVERQAAMDLVECDILQARANGTLASEGFIMENNVGISPETGDPIKKKELHIAMSVKDIIHKRKERLLKSLVATKESKRKLGVISRDPAKEEANLLERARKAKQAAIIAEAEIVGEEKK